MDINSALNYWLSTAFLPIWVFFLFDPVSRLSELLKTLFILGLRSTSYHHHCTIFCLMEPKFNRMKILLIILGLLPRFFIQQVALLTRLVLKMYKVPDSSNIRLVTEKDGIPLPVNTGFLILNWDSQIKIRTINLSKESLISSCKSKVNDPRFQKNFIDKEKSVSGKTEQPVQGKKRSIKFIKLPSRKPSSVLQRNTMYRLKTSRIGIIWKITQSNLDSL